MADMWMEFKGFYWAHRGVFRLLAAGGLFITVQFGILLQNLRDHSAVSYRFLC